MIAGQEHFLRMTRHFNASPERVFDAWLNPETTRCWLFTSPADVSQDAGAAKAERAIGNRLLRFQPNGSTTLRHFTQSVSRYPVQK